VWQKKIEGNTEPSTYSEAINSTDCSNWVTAMDDEMESLEEWHLGLGKITKRKEAYSLQVDFQKK